MPATESLCFEGAGARAGAGVGRPGSGATDRGEVVTTRSVPAHESLEFWHDAVMTTLVGMDIETGGRTYDATMRIDRIGEVGITTVDCDPAEVHRTSHFIARGDCDHVFVALQSTGSAQFEQDGRTAELRPGDLALVETLRPYRMRYPERFQMKIFMVRRDVLGRSVDDLRQLTGRAVKPTTGLAALLSPFMDRLADTSTSFDTRTAHRLAQSLTGLMAATAAERLSARSEPSPGADRALVVRIKAFIRWHLSDPGLSPQDIAHAHGISVRYLHKLFEAEGTSVSRWIREIRLRECRDELSAARGGTVNVGRIARRWGFSGSTQLGRAFRDIYGQSPSEWIQHKRAGNELGRGQCAAEH